MFAEFTAMQFPIQRRQLLAGLPIMRNMSKWLGKRSLCLEICYKGDGQRTWDEASRSPVHSDDGAHQSLERGGYQKPRPNRLNFSAWQRR